MPSPIQDDREWDAHTYHRISQPQRRWGLGVLQRLPLTGSETVLDAGCGSGGLTAELAARLPRGRVVAVDGSAGMVELARTTLAHLGERVQVRRADLTTLRLDVPVDAVFSNAVFHHIHDHAALFRAMHACLRPGGRLVAQCGGGPNLHDIRALVRQVCRSHPGRTALMGWDGPWNHADGPSTERRLGAAGFTRARAWVVAAPVHVDGAERFREHLRTVTLRSHLMRLEESARAGFLDDMVAAAARADPPFTLDHWRLNIDAVRGDPG